MTLYVDDDSCAAALMAMLRKAGHDVLIPADIGMSGSHDAEHLLRSIQEGRVFQTRNYTDFDPIHKLIIGCSGVHFGILVIRQENDRRKNMSYKAIVTAIGKVEQAYADLGNELVILNDWR
jgi:hypothetical protein